MKTLVLCSGVLIALYAALSLNVSLTRQRKRQSASVTEADLTKAIRAHGNASEYIPLFVAGFLFLSIGEPDSILSVIAVVATASRIAHAAGMLLVADVTQRHSLRTYGALGTYIALFALGVALLLRAFG